MTSPVQAVPASFSPYQKSVVAMLAFLFAGFTALCVGLLRIFLRPGMVTPDTIIR